MITKAVCVGDNCVDDYLPPVDLEFVGGNALNVAVHLRRCNVPTSYVGFVGDDPEGAFVLDSLQEVGVDTTRVRVLHGQTGITHVGLTERGDRVFVKEEMGVQKDAVLDEDQVSFASQHGLVHTSLQGGAEQFLARFRRLGAIVSFDYSDQFAETLLDSTLAEVDVAFVSFPKGSETETQDLAVRLRMRGPQIVVITRGAAGSNAFDGNKFYESPAPPTRVVDTLGAGDAFIGGFLAAFISKQPVRDCLARGGELAAQVCSHHGAWIPPLPSPRDVMRRKR